MSISDGGHLGTGQSPGQVIGQVFAERGGPTVLSERAQKYKKAAEIYKKTIANISVFETSSICRFVESDYWQYAIEMLESCGSTIRIGFLENDSGERIEYFLGGNGFFSKVKNYKETVTQPIVINTDNTLEIQKDLIHLAMAFRSVHEGEEVPNFLDFIHGQLDEEALFAKEIDFSGSK